MWEYSDKVLDHYRNPRNVGSIENPDMVGEAGSLACGDSLKLFIKLDAIKVVIHINMIKFLYVVALSTIKLIIWFSKLVLTIILLMPYVPINIIITLKFMLFNMFMSI